MSANLPGLLYTAEQVRQLDRIAIDSRGVPGLSLMRRAANACVKILLQRWPDTRSVSVFCGSGNNAGDGYIIAGMLSEQNIQVTVLVAGLTDKLSADAKAGYEYCKSTSAKILDFTAAGALETQTGTTGRL